MLEYIVKSGETLGTIAALILGDSRRYTEILSWNPQITNPNVIQVGQRIYFPVMMVPPSKAGLMSPASSQPAAAPATAVTPKPLTSGVTVSQAPTIASQANVGTGILAVLKDPKTIAAGVLAVGLALYLGSKKPVT